MNLGLGSSFRFGRSRTAAGERHRRHGPDGGGRRLRLNARQKRRKKVKKQARNGDKHSEINIPEFGKKICSQTA
jgi:hypothetical protein